MPKDVLGKGLTASALKELDLANGHGDDGEREFETATLASRVSQLSIRPQHETLEEKKYVTHFNIPLHPLWFKNPYSSLWCRHLTFSSFFQGAQGSCKGVATREEGGKEGEQGGLQGGAGKAGQGGLRQ